MSMNPTKTNWMKVAAVQTVIFLIGLAGIEVILELIAPLPIPGGIYVDRNGHPVRVALDELSLAPNLDIIHKGTEFTARIRTNRLGYRIIDNENRRPDFIWLGDSFTFGHGVSDEKTFPYLVCTRNGFVCQNLGHSGAGTFQEIDILVRAITKIEFHPKHVILVMLTACWIEQAGNDLGDNLSYERVHFAEAKAQAAADRVGMLKRLQGIAGNYELVKRTLLVFSTWIKRSTYQCSNPDQIHRAIAATKTALDKLQGLAHEFGFGVTVVEIHPYQELAGAYRQTEQLVSGIIPKTFAHIPTGQYFNKDDYYPYDGHFNATGDARLAVIVGRELKQP
jgi:hypothetical protein